ncbi:MAG: CTP synthase [Parcubacteria group bacterium Licking1014_1]|nr:MAG: CTP synthase [Parcubacteria group bacterium Licking1014_1]
MENISKFRHGQIFTYRYIRQIISDWILEETKNSEITVMEIGGTIGDKESEILFDTLNLLKSQQKISVYTIMISPYFMHAESAGLEMSYRSKMTRQAFEKSWRLGLMPNAIIFRVPKNLQIPRNDLDLIGSDTGLQDAKDVYLDPDFDNIYELPKCIHDQSLDKNVLKYFGLNKLFVKKTSRLEKYMHGIKSAKKELLLGVFGKTVSDDSFISLREAIDHAGVVQDTKVKIVWLDDSQDYKQELLKVDVLIIGEGLNYVQQKIDALTYARENSIPCLAVSFGCSLLVKEFFEKNLNKKIAIEELRENGPLIINKTDLKTGSVKLSLISPVHYEKLPIDERIRHWTKYPEKLEDILNNSDLQITGINIETKQPVIFENKNHPFYVGCMFHPEYISHPGHPHSLFVKLIKKGLKHKDARKTMLFAI